MERISSIIKIERIERGATKKPFGIRSCKTFRNALSTLIGKQYKNGNKELEFYTKGILDLYNHYHPEKKLNIPINQWKGKSTFEILDKIDRIVIIKYQKPSENEEPKKIETEVYKSDIQILLDCIVQLSKDYEKIPTKVLSMLYSKRLGLKHSGWKVGENPVFSDRKFHNSYALTLSALHKLGLVEYKVGTTKFLNKIAFQEALDNFIDQ